MAYAKTPEDLAFYESLGPDSKPMRSKPEISEEAMMWHEAFAQLSASRPAGFSGALPIPITEVDAYCRITGVAPREQPAFLRMIRRLDAGYLELATRKPVALKQPEGD